MKIHLNLHEFRTGSALSGSISDQIDEIHEVYLFASFVEMSGISIKSPSLPWYFHGQTYPFQRPSLPQRLPITCMDAWHRIRQVKFLCV